jgi:hypothetical protein
LPVLPVSTASRRSRAAISILWRERRAANVNGSRRR